MGQIRQVFNDYYFVMLKGTKKVRENQSNQPHQWSKKKSIQSFYSIN